MSDHTYQAIIRTFSWWQYQPADERELKLFQQAYQRFFWSSACFMVTTFSILELILTETITFPELSNIQLLRLIEVWLLIGFISSYSVGSTAFRNQDIKFKTQHSYITYALPIIVVMNVIILLALWLLQQ